MDNQQVYASIDLELSGFDPVTDEIIEIGIIRFVVEDGVCKVLSEWGTLVRPSSNIRNRILGLTGILPDEAARAPLWSEVEAEVFAQLKDVIIVGHGLDLDIKFLEAKGLTFALESIDTLELSQIFLPTHHSYNLENLAHACGVVHTDTHRALSDAFATLEVLKKLIGVFWALPEASRATLMRVLAMRKNTWGELFKLAFKTEVFVFNNTAGSKELPEYVLPSEVLSDPWSIIQVQTGNRAEPEWAHLNNGSASWVVAFPSREQVVAIGEQGHATPYLGAYETLSQRAVQDLIERAQALEKKELTALLKVLVWLSIGTKHGLLAELNWSIIGTEMKRLFNAGFSAYPPSGVVASDYRSLADFKGHRNAWIADIDSFSAFLEQKSGQQFSWHSTVSALKSIYNPETGFGDSSQKEKVIEALCAVDVFFASVLLLLKKHLLVTDGVVSIRDMDPYVRQKCLHGIRNLVTKLANLFIGNVEQSLLRVFRGLEAYLGLVENIDYVCWLELADGRCAFVARPTSLKETVRSLLGAFNQVVFTTDMQSPAVLKFMQARLGLETAHILALTDRVESDILPKLVVSDDSLTKSVLAVLNSMESGAILFPNITSLKNFYDENYEHFVSTKEIVAVGIHGGVNKILRNFVYGQKSIVLVALPSLQGYIAEGLRLETLVLAGLPDSKMDHPYSQSLSRSYFSTEFEFKRAMQVIGVQQALRIFSLRTLKSLTIVAEKLESEFAEHIISTLFVN